jgi:hypothetical protein
MPGGGCVEDFWEWPLSSKVDLNEILKWRVNVVQEFWIEYMTFTFIPAGRNYARK